MARKDKIILFELIDRGTTYVLEHENGTPIRFPRVYSIPKQTTAKNPKTGRIAPIRYFRTASSPWVHEQVKNGDLDIYENDGNGNPKIPFTDKVLKFTDGFLTVKGDDLTKLEYLRLLSGNQANGGKKFRERDFIAEAKKAAKSKLEIATGIKAVMLLDDDKLLYAHTAYFPEADSHEPSIMTAQLLDVAEYYANTGDLDTFIHSLDSTETFETYRTVQMFKMGMFKLNGDGRIMQWATGQPIVDIPIGEEPYEYVTDWFMTHEKGRIVHRQAIKKYKDKTQQLEEVKEEILVSEQEHDKFKYRSGNNLYEELKGNKLLHKHGPKAFKLGKGEAMTQINIATKKDLCIALNDRKSDERRVAIQMLERFAVE